jgi:RNA polymerase sigma-70 factor (ECF subfamily)
MGLSVPPRPSRRLRLAASHGHLEDPTAAPSRLTAGEPAAPSLDDTQLLEAMRRGDVTAAKAFHDRVRSKAQRTVSRLLGRGDPDDDDLVQLAVIELVTTIARFRGECSLDTWIAMVSARVVYKHIRKKRGERRLLESVRRVDATSAAPGQVGRDALLRDLAVRLRDHLAELDPDKAWTFVLHDVCGYDLREIAQITGASLAAAQTRLTRGRRELHDRIASDPELTGWLEDAVGEP